MYTYTVCTAFDGVDIIFGIYMELGKGTTNDVPNGDIVEEWLIDSVIPNINTDRSRVGMIVFGNQINQTLNIGSYDMDTLTQSVQNISWPNDWEYNDIPPMIDEALEQFESIQESFNTQQILVIITDDNPEALKNGKSPFLPLCQYRNALSDLGIYIEFFLTN